MNRDFSVVVVGGGPAGAAAATILARAGRRVLLLDDSMPTAFRVGESLPPAARPLLRDLGLLDRFLADGHLPCYGNLSAWGSDEVIPTDFIRDPHGHGWHLDRARFDQLLRELAGEAGVEVMPGMTLVHCQPAGDERWLVRIAGTAAPTSEVRCRWLLDATGRRCAVARRRGATIQRDDALVAVYARFRQATSGRADADSRTLVETTPDGWWYSVLVPSGERVIAYLTDADLLTRAALRSAAGFLAALRETRHLGRHAVPGYADGSRPHGADAGSRRLNCFVGERWAAVGDAALAFDPLSAQGILTALYSGLQAGQAVDRFLAGDPNGLREYENQLDRIYAAYRTNLANAYALERRWTDQPFWQRRSNSGHHPPEVAEAGAPDSR